MAEEQEPPVTQPQRGPLAELIEDMARRAAARKSEVQEAQDYFRSTWARLSADRRLSQSLAKVPENAGPLNSHHLVHRSLRLMRELSPEYLQHFVSYVDGLLWLDQLHTAATPPAGSPRAERAKKTARSKSA